MCAIEETELLGLLNNSAFLPHNNRTQGLGTLTIKARLQCDRQRKYHILPLM